MGLSVGWRKSGTFPKYHGSLGHILRGVGGGGHELEMFLGTLKRRELGGAPTSPGKTRGDPRRDNPKRKTSKPPWGLVVET